MANDSNNKNWELSIFVEFLCSSSDYSQLRIKNVEKIAKSVKNLKISKPCIKIWGNTDYFLNSAILWKNQ